MKRSNFTWGVILLLLGCILLFQQARPDLARLWFGPGFPWPVLILAVGLIFLAGSLVGGTSGMMIPGAIITTVGGILFYQNATGNWESWEYLWPLIPAAVGLGLVLSSLVGERNPATRKTGFYMLAISLAVFIIFLTLFTAALNLNLAWAAILILAGLYLLLRTSTKKR